MIKPLLKKLFIFTCASGIVCADDVSPWGEDLRVHSVWEGRVRDPKFRSKRLRVSEPHVLEVREGVNGKELLPYWYRIEAQGGAWTWMKSGSPLDPSCLDRVMEIEMGYDFLNPIPIRVDSRGVRKVGVEVEAWVGSSWSPYRSALFRFHPTWVLPNEVRWLEAWQVSAGIKTVAWPVELLKTYPRSAYLSAEKGLWRGMSVVEHHLGGVIISEFQEGGLGLGSTRSSFDWKRLFFLCSRPSEDLVRGLKGVMRKERWEKVGLYPIIPLLIARSHVDVLELVDKKDLQNYRFLLERGHRLSHTYLNKVDKVGPDLFLERRGEGFSDLRSLKEGRWMSGGGFAFDYFFYPQSDLGQKHRMGDLVSPVGEAYKPLLRFSDHPNYESMALVKLFKGTEEMVEAAIPKSVAKGTLDLGLYHLSEGGAMTLEIQHRDGRVSVANPIYFGKGLEEVKGFRSLPMVIRGLPEGAEVVVQNGLTASTYKAVAGAVELEVAYVDEIHIQVGEVQRHVRVLDRWLDQATRSLNNSASFEEQYAVFERAFPLVYHWEPIGASTTNHP